MIYYNCFCNYRGVLWILLVVLESGSAKLLVRGHWQENFGWEVTCSWDMENDTLNAARLIRNGQQYFIYRPDQYGLDYSFATQNREYKIGMDCSLTADRRRGKCVTTLDLYASSAAVEETYECETSGEGPHFLLDISSFKAYVAPTPAEVTRQPSKGSSPRVSMYCTSSAIPPPHIEWTVEGAKIPAEFSRRKWNSTTKLWQETSSISLESHSLASKAVCTPSIITSDNKIVKGASASGVAEVCAMRVLLSLTAVAVLLR